jgi:hypothetical protein
MCLLSTLEYTHLICTYDIQPARDFVASMLQYEGLGLDAVISPCDQHCQARARPVAIRSTTTTASRLPPHSKAMVCSLHSTARTPPLIVALTHTATFRAINREA